MARTSYCVFTGRVISTVLETLQSIGEDVSNGLTVDCREVVEIGKNSAHVGIW